MYRSHRLLTVAAVALLLAAVSAVAYTGAVFNYQTQNPGNAITSGIVAHNNDKNNSAIVTLATNDFLPGDTQTGTVTITNASNVLGLFSLSCPTTNFGALAPACTVTITDTSVTPNQVVYTGTLSGLHTASPITLNSVYGTNPVQKWGATESHTYSVAVHFNDGGTPPDNTSGDNAYQNKTLSFELDWTNVGTH
jgi:hypothetical protein